MRFYGGFLAFAGAVAAFAAEARAEEMRFRFEAELKHVHIAPPPGSTTMQASELPVLTGVFGVSTAAERVAEASLPGRVAFATYATGMITVDQLEISTIPGPIVTQVTDGITQRGTAETTITDALLIATDGRSADAPVDAVSLELRYDDAEKIEGVEIPSTLHFDDFASIRLTFSTRVDALSDRAEGASDTVEVLGLVTFEITKLEPVD